jgi:hypothetical protein
MTDHRHKDYAYEWNEWKLRHKALQLVKLRKCRTVSQQTDASHFRRENDSQVRACVRACVCVCVLCVRACVCLCVVRACVRACVCLCALCVRACVRACGACVCLLIQDMCSIVHVMRSLTSHRTILTLTSFPPTSEPSIKTSS